MPAKFWLYLSLLLMLGTAGCGRFMARRMAQSPNTYPTWFAPAAPVELAFDPAFLTNTPSRLLTVEPPNTEAQLHYRVVEPGDYHLRMIVTNWTTRGRARTRYSYRTELPGSTNAWSAAPRGTVVLLHGYGLAQFAMVPWALRLSQDGWRCVLVDLRGHGQSTGRRIFFGVQEARDLSQLLDALARDGELVPPVSALGESYGAALALRWKTVEPRLQSVVAIAPYASLSNATLNLSREYARWFPQFLLKAGLKQLPAVLEVKPEELDTTKVLEGHAVTALIIAGTQDRIMPLIEVNRVFGATAPGSKMIEVAGATHETVPYCFDSLATVVRAWLDRPTHGGSDASAD